MLKRLQQDHRHIATLLKILRTKHIRLRDGDFVNFNLVRDIVEYMQGYAEHSHHPMEDLIYEYFSAKETGHETSSRLAQEHIKLAEASRSLMVSLNLILSDVVVAKDKLATELEEYVHTQALHMEYEESVVFPMLLAEMTEEDWQTIEELTVQKLIDDPLFSGNDNQLYEDLRQYIATAES